MKNSKLASLLTRTLILLSTYSYSDFNYNNVLFTLNLKTSTPIISVSNSTPLVGSTITFNITGGRAPYSISYTGEGTVSNVSTNTTSNTAAGEISSNSTGSATMSVTDRLGSLSNQVTVTFRGQVYFQPQTYDATKASLPIGISTTGCHGPFSVSVVSSDGTTAISTYSDALIPSDSSLIFSDASCTSQVTGISISSGVSSTSYYLSAKNKATPATSYTLTFSSTNVVPGIDTTINVYQMTLALANSAQATAGCAFGSNLSTCDYGSTTVNVQKQITLTNILTPISYSDLRFVNMDSSAGKFSQDSDGTSNCLTSMSSLSGSCNLYSTIMAGTNGAAGGAITGHVFLSPNVRNKVSVSASDTSGADALQSFTLSANKNYTWSLTSTTAISPLPSGYSCAVATDSNTSRTYTCTPTAAQALPCSKANTESTFTATQSCTTTYSCGDSCTACSVWGAMSYSQALYTCQ